MANYDKVRTRFDEILGKKIKLLMEIPEDADTISYGLSTIICLLLIVERENEIKAFPKSPPDRFSRQSLLDELADMGLPIDDSLMVSIQDLTTHGFVTLGSNDKYHAQLPAFAISNYLDNLFPGMPGMSLVAYVMQTISEVVSERKEIEDALSQFQQTLDKRGVSISAAKIHTQSKDAIAETTIKPVYKKAPDIKTTLQVLSEIRSRTASESSEPAIVTKDGYVGQAKVKEIFPKSRPEPDNPPVTDSKPQKPAQSGAEKTADQEPEVPLEEQTLSPENLLEPDEVLEPEVSLDEINPDEINPEELLSEEPLLEEPEPETYAPEENLTPEPVKEPEPISEMSIEEQIREFETELLVACPICTTGKIKSSSTEKGKVYYSCSNSSCKFVSWGKPYHFNCPACNNNFLIEFTSPEGSIGLKCPRATCNYWQATLDNPLLRKKEAPEADKPKKKLVRKRLVRRKR